MRNNLCLLLISAIVLICGCDERKPLTGGYELFRHYGNVHAISSPEGRVIVLGDVNNVYEIDVLIVGERSRPDGNDASALEADTQPYGYFIFNKNSKSLTLGLSKGERDAELHQLGIKLN